MLVFLLAALENDEDKKLFTEIYEQYRPQMERTAMHFLKSHADVEDAVQNAFMQMIRHFEKIYEIPCEELSFWIISIVKNEALSLIHHHAKESMTKDGFCRLPLLQELRKTVHALMYAYAKTNGVNTVADSAVQQESHR